MLVAHPAAMMQRLRRMLLGAGILFVPCAACADLIGTDFSGVPRAEGASAEGGQDDATLSGTDAADARTSDADALVDANDPYWASCSARIAQCSCQGYPFPVDGGAPCDETSFPSGFCCADPDYPSGGQCTCSTWTCHTGSLGECLCGAYAEGGVGEACSGAFCCAQPPHYTCRCFDASSACPTDPNIVPVASCTEAQQPCPNGGRRVTSCTSL